LLTLINRNQRYCKKMEVPQFIFGHIVVKIGLQGPTCQLHQTFKLPNAGSVLTFIITCHRCVIVSDSDTPESRRRMLSDSDSDVSDIPPELPPRTPSRTLSNTIGTTSTNGETRSTHTVSIVSTDNNLTAFISDPWNNGIYYL